jgi:hypothetical protein
MFKTPSLSILGLLLLALTANGCILFVPVDDDDDDSAPTNSAPTIDDSSTSWRCDLDSSNGDYFWEFETLVQDADGLDDVDEVRVTVYEAGTGSSYGNWDLVDEGSGVWGGLVWEDESDLFCGDPVDVVFEAWDFFGASAILTLYYD